MFFILIIRDHIFAERFAGSRYTRFNQGQLEAIVEFSKWTTDQLIEMLSLRRNHLDQYDPILDVTDPCWIDSRSESKEHFDAVIYHLNEWSKYYAGKILDLKNRPNMQISRTGNFNK